MTSRRFKNLFYAGVIGLFAAGAAKYEPPAENPPAGSPNQALTEALDKADIPSANRIIDSALKDPEDHLFRDSTQTLFSAVGWTMAIDGPTRRKLMSAVPREIEDSAAMLLASLAANPNSTPEDFHKIACRYPFTRAAGQAWMEAGDRSVPLADAHAAATYYQLATNAGATLNEKRATNFTAAKEAARPAAAPAIFDAAWHHKTAWFTKAKYMPVSNGNVFYIAGARQAIAVKDGAQLWRWNAIDASSRAAPDRAAGTGRGPTFEPAVLGAANSAQIVIARQIRPGMKDQCLRAFKGTDGTLLWTTESAGAADSLSMVSNPTIAGRFVYATAVDFTANSARLTLVAFDAASGELVFKTTLGALSGMSKKREETGGFEGIWEQSAPLATDDCVYLSPNVGMVFAVDRFTGTIRFAKPYINPLAVEAAPKDANQSLRFRNTPVVEDGALVIAPQDAPKTYGYSARTGQLLWMNDAGAAHTLIGGSKGIAVFTGSAIMGIEAKSGKTVWSISPDGITGPAAVIDDVVYVPRTDGKTSMYSITTGLPTEGKKAADFRTPLNSAAVRKILEDGLMLQSFGR